MEATNKYFLIITDLHFNPCYDPVILNELVAAQASDWEEIFESSAITNISMYGEDTNYPLLASLCKDISQYTDAVFLLFSGDFLGHQLREKFSAHADDASEESFRTFITRTIEFLSLQFQQACPNKVIFPTLGNEDSFCGDYEISPLGEFLAMFTRKWETIMTNLQSGEESSFFSTFPLGGYYTAQIPTIPGHRLIVLNNIFMSRNYRNVDKKNPGDPSLAQLHWLSRELYCCKARGEKVWLIFHEPLGIDMYSALHGSTHHCTTNVRTFLMSQYADFLQRQLFQFSDIIEAMFCGHTHMDEFRILHDSEDKNLLFMHVTPSISPVFGNNPAYQLFNFEKDKAPLLDYVTRFINLDTTTEGAVSDWHEEYRFSDTYNQQALNIHSLFTIKKRFSEDTKVRESYMRFYNVSNKRYSLMNETNWQAFSDAIICNTRGDFIEC